MSKEEYSIREVSKSECKEILEKYHYLSKISRGFKSKFNYGLFRNGKMVGTCIFTGFPVPELLKGMYGLPRDQQDGFFELSRLCLDPSVQGSEHNIASWFVSRSIKSLRRETKVRSILSYADNDFHSGTVYAALNFKYYGLSSPKSDFWFLQPDGSYKKHSRGKTRGHEGEWRPRSRKHRFVLCFDKSLRILWEERKWGEDCSKRHDPEVDG